MRESDRKTPATKQAATATSPAGDQRRDDTLMRLRAALLEDRLTLMEVTGEQTGTDPYNSGVHRAMARADVWSKRSR
jgi:hypothetical protein